MTRKSCGAQICRKNRFAYCDSCSRLRRKSPNRSNRKSRALVRPDPSIHSSPHSSPQLTPDAVLLPVLPRGRANDCGQGDAPVGRVSVPLLRVVHYETAEDVCRAGAHYLHGLRAEANLVVYCKYVSSPNPCAKRPGRLRDPVHTQMQLLHMPYHAPAALGPTLDPLPSTPI